MNKIISYDMSTHTYMVEVEIKNKIFYGEAKCSKVDWDNESELFGYGLASDRAMSSYYSWLIRHYKKQYKLIKNFVSAVTQYKDFDSTSPSARKMFRQLNMYQKKIDGAKETKGFYDYCIKKRIEGVKGSKTASNS